VLKTLEKYIQPADDRDLSAVVHGWYQRDPRFAKILALSLVGHLIFYAAIIQLDRWSFEKLTERAGRSTDLVKLIDVAMPPPRPPRLRTPPQRLERADISRLRYDPETANDVDLVERSAKLGNPRARTDSPEQRKSSNDLAPPASQSPTAPKETAVAVTPLPPAVLRETPTQPAPAPGVSEKDAVARSTEEAAETGPKNPARGVTAGTRELGFHEIPAQYIARVRAKISVANERNMPRDWIRDTLRDKVSADFEIKLGRGGELLWARLVRSSGYSTLDRQGREAIYIAKPFEGYPQEAGDSIILTVTVYYSPTY
jgi:outer membrane biosynthesis protein TonB